MREQCAVLGIDPDRLIPSQLQLAVPGDYELWPEHAWAWTVYLGCGTQWVKTPVFGSYPRWEGLNYTGVEIVMRKYQVPTEMESDVFAQLQVLEVETVNLRNR